MKFLCESCYKWFLSTYTHQHFDQYLCWRCLPESSKAWHEANASEVREYHRQERLNEAEKKRIHPEDIL